MRMGRPNQNSDAASSPRYCSEKDLPRVRPAAAVPCRATDRGRAGRPCQRQQCRAVRCHALPKKPRAPRCSIAACGPGGPSPCCASPAPSRGGRSMSDGRGRSGGGVPRPSAAAGARCSRCCSNSLCRSAEESILTWRLTESTVGCGGPEGSGLGGSEDSAPGSAPWRAKPIASWDRRASPSLTARRPALSAPPGASEVPCAPYFSYASLASCSAAGISGGLGSVVCVYYHVRNLCA